MRLTRPASFMRNMSRTHFREVLSLCLLWLASALAASAQTFTVLHNFDGTDGNGTGIKLAQGRDGNLYGSAVFGGADGCGTAYRLAPSGTFDLISTFSSQACTPTGGFALGPDGLLYSNFQNGGASSDGGVFSLSGSGKFTLLGSFNGTDGANPAALVVLGTDGNFYGTDGRGGTEGLGTIYRSTPAGAITALHSFGTVKNDGSNPGSLIQGPGDAFYGVTGNGGAFGDGVVYRIALSGGYTILVNFDGSNGANSGEGGLLLASDGNFYGGTCNGGASEYGEVFSMTPAGALTVLHSFGGADGECPNGNLIEATDGKLYGTAIFGGAYGDGTIFSITTSGAFRVLHNFDGSDGTNPYGTLTQHTNGTLYGSAAFGGSTGNGVLFSLDLGLGPFVRFLLNSGKVGSRVQILGQGFTGTTAVSFNGTPASYTVASDTFLVATIPLGATTGPVVVTTPSGTLTSNVDFRVIP